MSNRGTIQVTQDAWHLRLYDWYIADNPWSAKQQEDLCHYFWTNARAVKEWFLHVGLVFGIAPVWFAIALTAIVSLAYSYTQWPAPTIIVLFCLGAAVTLVLCAFLLRGLLSLIGHRYRWIFTAFKWLTSPVWLPFWLTYLGLSEVNEYCERNFDHSLVGSFFLVHRFWVITPFTVTFAGLYALLVLQFGIEAVWAVTMILFWQLAPTVLGVFIASFVLAAVMIFFSYLKEKIIDWYYDRKFAKRQAQLASETPETTKPRGTSSYRMVFAYLKALKERFCPYIEIVRA